jgi:hypothetical protein
MGEMNRLSLKGIVIGNLTDILSTYIIVIPAALYMLTQGYAADPQALMKSSTFMGVSRILGALCSVLGGYVSARIARHDEVLNGALASILCVAPGVYTIFSGSAGDRLGQHLALIPLSVLLAAFGGYLGLRRRAWATP